MTPQTFKEWRKALGFKQKEVAEKLGLKKRVIQYYEKGHRDGKAVEIPKSIELACLALALGYEHYDAAVLPDKVAGEDTAADDETAASQAKQPGDRPGDDSTAASPSDRESTAKMPDETTAS
ncbi:helix-turn-helix transcriptional regulator [Jiella sp. CQZ9-1]|uniref:Helix-turn-helix transcriptional regulator n=2 Tax=Jiella flava TaxID=2816857 RepID=A0A939FXL1_9HYPH|nr:helix-turn-helix transcriptional regulator [Jiella flava]